MSAPDAGGTGGAATATTGIGGVAGSGGIGGAGIEPGTHLQGTSVADSIEWLDGRVKSTHWETPDTVLGMLQVFIKDQPDLCTVGELWSNSTSLEIELWDGVPLSPGDFVVGGTSYD